MPRLAMQDAVLSPKLQINSTMEDNSATVDILVPLLHTTGINSSTLLMYPIAQTWMDTQQTVCNIQYMGHII